MDQILIADDDNIDRKLIETYLSKANFEVVSTTNGKEAWDVIRLSNEPPQIVIIDWLMPEMDGIALCKKIREMKSDHYIYVILVTGKSMTTDMVQGLEAGADDYLTKPYEKAVLLARINVGLRIVRLERERSEQLLKIQMTNQKLQQNMESAVQIQLSLLPPNNYNIGPYKFDWLFKPSEMLGGDMLHVYKVSDTKVACYVLDVSGHGAEAALLSVTIRNQLTSNSPDYPEGHSQEGLISIGMHNLPLDVITKLSFHYGDLLERTGHFFTIVFGILDISTGVFDYVSAGHYNPVLISNNKTLSSMDSSGIPVGMFHGTEYQQQKIQIGPDDQLFLFSDGIIEQTNDDDDQYGIDRMVSCLKENSSSSNFQDTLLNDIKRFSGKESFDDDIALIKISHQE